MKQKQLKTNVLKKQVITKIKERVERAKKSGVDMEVVKKQLITAIKQHNEKRTITLLEKIASHSDHKDLVAIMTQVEKAITKNKVAFPKAFEVVQTMKPKWYVAPHEEVSIKNTVKVEGSVKTEVDAGYWTAFGAVLGVAMSGLFEYLNKFAQKTFRVMPAKEHYTTPQMVVIADPKTGRPVSLKDIGQGGGQTIVQVTGGKSSGGSSTGGTDPVGLKDTGGTPVNPATEDTLALMLAQLQAIEANTDNLEITADTINLNTDTLEAKLQSLIDQGPSQILKATIDLTGSGDILTPTAGQKLRVYAIKFSQSADMTSVAFNFGAVAAFEKYLNTKGGGLYGSNITPNYVQGATDEKLKLVLVGTGTVTINVDYKIVP